MKNLIVLIVITVLITSCRKNTACHYTVSQTLIDHFSYKPGSYWIYKDSITNNIDSLAIYDTQISSFSASCQASASSPQGTAEEIVILGRMYGSAGQIIDSNFKLRLSSQIYYSIFDRGFFLCDYPFVIRNDGGGGFIRTIPDLEVNGKHYSNVGEVHRYNMPGDTFLFEDWVYINDHAGIIKMSIDRPQAGLKKVYSLLRYNIILQ